MSINNTKTDMVYETKFLGVLIDNKLNWKDHIDMMKAKLSKSIGIMYKAKHLLNRTSKITLYCSLFLPYITYCCEVLGNTYKTNINDICVTKESSKNCMQCELPISFKCVIS